METKLNLKPIDFKFSQYLSQGFEILKKDFGKFFVGFLFTIIMSIIPFCGLMALGNFYKFSRKVFKGEPAEASEIFNFDDFMPYFILQLIIIGAILVLEIPIIIVSVFGSQLGDSFSSLGFLIPIYMIGLLVFLFYFLIKGFYIPALISVARVKDLKTAWNMSKEMTTGIGWNILLFVIVVSFLSQLGIILCGIGIFLTLPYNYVTQFLAYEDAINQITYDEIKEIGSEQI
ncbi:hypothetical protein [Kaistella jeonii]|uniref:Glycerophosphoryl diester phosphodiesterase membrane domain-containing protein n=1 Tax=Kaistella jeonii TaxID=266749 RepID=A0A0C1CY47_9FLAO|nr:hypothetical protein [Kaistella jeonii]KIA89291.1 hypothetical protein OA86_06735 [Kaistella jeonii]SFC02019.1 hypothetical protein SAMN05421876_10568 [Kaistella jeonii]VEI96602.1 Predicted integral membrane protein [Kaistella jeonii]